ncbi:MAG: 16S rRNA (guanine(527)-N(7))-methyltransferase RsmG [Proteobacteria bacterium]|nr:16S rRNA (guanine(527)-N(7))-methyltransferase RsmG [Pseudomonadota bacterium]
MDQFADRAVGSAVERALTHLGLAAEDGFRRALALYAAEVSKWNRRVNLTGAKTAEAFVDAPLFDALTLLPVLAEDAPLVDIGSGGGLPGLPAALYRRDLRVVLVEPRAKRASFLRHAVRVLGLSCDVVEARAEQLEAGAYGAAVSQAVWPAAEWLGRAIRLVTPAGAIYALSSTPITDSDLPPGCRIDAVFETKRPLDGAPRFAVRVRWDVK